MDVGVGQRNASRVGVESEGSLADDDCKVSMQCKILHSETIFTDMKKKTNNLAPSAYKVPFMLEESLCNYCLTGQS